MDSYQQRPSVNFIITNIFQHFLIFLFSFSLFLYFSLWYLIKTILIFSFLKTISTSTLKDVNFFTFSLLRLSVSSVASLNFRLGSFASLSFPINQIILLIGCYFLSISIFTNQSAFNLIIIIVQFYHI